MRSIERALGPLESQDPFLRRALLAMVQCLTGTDAGARMAAVQLYVVDYRFAPKPILHGRFFTDNCAALRDENAILVNERFLLETEAAVRSFDLAGELLLTPYLRSDGDLFAWVDRIQPDPRPYLERLRALDQLPGREEADARAVEQFAMLLLFLIGHELGHLTQGYDQRAFGSFVSAQAPLETRVGNAVLKLGRHAREFARLGFELPGFQQATDDACEVVADQQRWREAQPEIDLNHTHWFEDEVGADEHASALVQQALGALAAQDGAASDRRLVQLVNALFATALFHWQRDLGLFLRKLGLPSLADTQQLALTMVQQREHYIHAASLFGDVHRFTLLRAIIAIDQWLHARGLFEQPLDKPVCRAAPAAPRAPLEPAVAVECVRRKLLLQIHVDTAVKIAYVGSSTGWLLEADARNGARQLFLMQFESIRAAVDRLQAMV